MKTGVARMKAAKIPWWIETHRWMKWRLAMRIASLPDERWAKKAATWNPGLSTMHQTNRLVGRPRKRWEDEINNFLKPVETEETKGNEKQQRHLDKSGKKIEKDGKQWKANTQRQQPQHPLTVCTAEEILSKIQFDQHATWTAWSWMNTRWRPSRCHTPRTSMTLIDTAADTAYEPRKWNQTSKNWSWKGWWAQTTLMTESAALFPETLFPLLMNPWIQQLCSSFLFFPGTHMCRRD